MASKMYQLLYSNEPPETDTWDPATMHIRCFCHKIALVVNAGLVSLLMKTMPPAKAKESVLGFFPFLGKLVEENKDPSLGVDGSATRPSNANFIATPLGNYHSSQSDYGNADNDHSDAKTEIAPNPESGSNNKQLPKAQRASFSRMANKLGLKVAPLIAGYRICWNVKYKSRRKAIDAREVIDELLKEDQNHNQTGVFNNVFVKLTSKMEGNHSTGAHVILKYLKLKEQLSGKIRQSEATNALYPMYHAMLKRIEKYLTEAMQCKTLFLATIIHPCYWMHISELVFGAESTEVKECLKILSRRLLDYKYKKVLGSTLDNTDPASGITVIEKLPETEPVPLLDWLATLATQNSTPQENEIEAFLKANLCFTSEAIKNHLTPLKWWRNNCKTFPTLASMARAYLGASASSCAVERLFSSASDVCSSRRGGLQPSNMSHCSDFCGASGHARGPTALQILGHINTLTLEHL
ncbi:hypothetical protein PCANC_10235 [Puccinia coronata f. sp. avenae]|uniref:HAT C-terminal dimerisation domain-containing protein n=1 Tax=Puccinia coronata f. sp. avenae TaxID=200324 RepID=A0A2N5VEM1_9BASI|nr:hypothetical protein PCANC_10235 [Puccinia coronata f. sp. avenae]